MKKNITVRGLVASLIQLVSTIMVATSWPELRTGGSVAIFFGWILLMTVPLLANGFLTANGILDPITDRMHGWRISEFVVVIVAIGGIVLSLTAPTIMLGATAKILHPSASGTDLIVYAIASAFWMVHQAVLIVCAHIGYKRATRWFDGGALSSAID